jgi:hypothetical protein
LSPGRGESTKKFSGLWGPTARGEGRVVNQEIPMLVEGVGGVNQEILRLVGPHCQG